MTRLGLMCSFTRPETKIAKSPRPGLENMSGRPTTYSVSATRKCSFSVGISREWANLHSFCTVSCPKTRMRLIPASNSRILGRR